MPRYESGMTVCAAAGKSASSAALHACAPSAPALWPATYSESSGDASPGCARAHAIVAITFCWPAWRATAPFAERHACVLLLLTNASPEQYSAVTIVCARSGLSPRARSKRPAPSA